MQRRPCGNQPELALKIAAVVEANLEKSRAYAYPTRTAMEVITDKSKMRNGTKLQREDFPSEDGTWLPRAGELSFVMKVVEESTLRGVSTETFSEFKNFQVDSKITLQDR